MSIRNQQPLWVNNKPHRALQPSRSRGRAECHQNRISIARWIIEYLIVQWKGHLDTYLECHIKIKCLRRRVCGKVSFGHAIGTPPQLVGLSQTQITNNLPYLINLHDFHSAQCFEPSSNSETELERSQEPTMETIQESYLSTLALWQIPITAQTIPI